MSFKIQIPSDFIRDKTFDSASLYVYMKLVQRFYVYKKKYSTFEIDHKQFMFYCGIKSNKKFKIVLDELHERELVINKIDSLPRRGLLKIELNTFFDKSDKKYKFTQFPVEILDKSVLDEIGHQGVRLLFYFQSYINKPTDFCYCSTKRIENEIDMSENTIIKYSELLHKKKYIKKVKHKLETTYEYEEDEFGNERLVFTKYNNHYHIRYEKFIK